MKVKIHRKEIIDLCNWRYENFGMFAKFLDGLLVDGYLICEGSTDVVQTIIADNGHLCGLNCSICRKGIYNFPKQN
jgi:hypothetical protein